MADKLGAGIADCPVDDPERFILESYLEYEEEIHKAHNACYYSDALSFVKFVPKV